MTGQDPGAEPGAAGTVQRAGGLLRGLARGLWRLFVLAPDELAADEDRRGRERRKRRRFLAHPAPDRPERRRLSRRLSRTAARASMATRLWRARLRPRLEVLRARLSVRSEAAAARTQVYYGRSPRWMRALAWAIPVIAVLVFATTPLDFRAQVLVCGSLWVLALVVRQLDGPGAALALMTISLLATSRYVYWRCTGTLDLEPGAAAWLGAGLLLAEAYTWVILLLGYFQNARPLGRTGVPLPADRALWPSVDVYITTYNEPLEVVRSTLLAALELDWPADRLKVWLLDDGNRETFRRFAADCGAGYLARTDNRHAKAGNLNHALARTGGEFIAMFDCDHIPVRSFLTQTVGWFRRDARCALVQTPHHFYSPDPFERNLGTFRRVPNEGSLFYWLVQDGNDLWNSAFFCGSGAVLRRAALERAGGVATDTVTEDAHTALRLHRLGYGSVYLRQILAAGLATENVPEHVKQRIRWARGMAQIFRIDNPLLGPGLTWSQRLCYLNAMLHFFSGVPRLVFLTAPLAYLYLELHVINAAAPMLAAYALPHLALASIANSNVQRRYRHSFWNEAYEVLLSWYIALPTTLALFSPHHGRFNVTAKGVHSDREYYEWRLSAPYLVLVAANLGGALIALPRLFAWNSFEAGTVLINLAWTVFNLAVLGAVLGVNAERRQQRLAPRVQNRLRVRLHLAGGATFDCHTRDFSMRGVGLQADEMPPLHVGERLQVGLWDGGREVLFPAAVVLLRGREAGIRWLDLDLGQERALVRCTFGRPDCWSDWMNAPEPDRPLASFAEVFSFGVAGYVSLWGNLGRVLRAWRAGPRPAASGR